MRRIAIRFLSSILGLGLLSVASIATAHDNQGPHKVPGLRTLEQDRQLEFHKHWLLACGTDVIFGVDRCKAQTFHFDEFNGEKIPKKYTLELSTWESIEKERFHNISFWPAKGLIDFSKPMSISLDYGTEMQLLPNKHFHRNGLHPSRAVISDLQTSVDLIASFKKGDNLRLTFQDTAGQSREAMLSLIGFRKALAQLENKEASPRASIALAERAKIENRMFGQWNADDRGINISNSLIQRQEKHDTTMHTYNATGGGEAYATVVHGITDFDTALEMFKILGFNNDKQMKHVLSHFFRPGNPYPASVVHSSKGMIFTAEIGPDKGVLVDLNPKKQAVLTSVFRSKDGSKYTLPKELASN